MNQSLEAAPGRTGLAFYRGQLLEFGNISRMRLGIVSIDWRFGHRGPGSSSPLYTKASGDEPLGWTCTTASLDCLATECGIGRTVLAQSLNALMWRGRIATRYGEISARLHGDMAW